MQAIEIDTEIDDNGEIHIKLPEPRQPGPARVIVLFDTDQKAPARPPRHRPSSRLAHKGARPHGDDTPDDAEPNDFAGIWADFSDEDFQGFLCEIEDRRRDAFARRPTR